MRTKIGQLIKEEVTRQGLTAPLDFHLIHAFVPVNQNILALPALVKSFDHPTAHGYRQNEWVYVSDFISEKRDIKEEYRLKKLIQDVIDFNET